MKIHRPDKSAPLIDIRLVRRLLRGYVLYHRRKGWLHNWPDYPVDGAARSPGELAKHFLKDVRYNTHRQHRWVKRLDRKRGLT